MNQVAESVWQIPLTPRNGINVYLLGEVLVDAGTPGQGKKLAKTLASRTVAAHAVTHAHPDHIGGSHPVCTALGVPFWCPAGDAPAAREGKPVAAESRLKPLLDRNRAWEPLDVARELREGDDVAGFTVVDVPGHSPGHVAFWRESDRTVVAGDVWFNISLLTFRYGLRPPPGIFTVDAEPNRQSMRKLAELEPEVACFGHGPPVTGAAAKLRAFVAKL